MGRGLVKRLEQLSRGDGAMTWTRVKAAEKKRIGLPRDCDAGQAGDGGRMKDWERVSGMMLSLFLWAAPPPPARLASCGQQGAPKAWLDLPWGTSRNAGLLWYSLWITNQLWVSSIL